MKFINFMKSEKVYTLAFVVLLFLLADPGNSVCQANQVASCSSIQAKVEPKMSKCILPGNENGLNADESEKLRLCKKSCIDMSSSPREYCEQECEFEAYCLREWRNALPGERKNLEPEITEWINSLGYSGVQTMGKGGKSPNANLLRLWREAKTREKFEFVTLDQLENEKNQLLADGYDDEQEFKNQYEEFDKEVKHRFNNWNEEEEIEECKKDCDDEYNKHDQHEEHEQCMEECMEGVEWLHRVFTIYWMIEKKHQLTERLEKFKSQNLLSQSDQTRLENLALSHEMSVLDDLVYLRALSNAEQLKRGAVALNRIEGEEIRQKYQMNQAIQMWKENGFDPAKSYDDWFKGSLAFNWTPRPFWFKGFLYLRKQITNLGDPMTLVDNFNKLSIMGSNQYSKSFDALCKEVCNNESDKMKCTEKCMQQRIPFSGSKF